MTPYFSFVLTERPLFSLFSPSPKDPYFEGLGRTSPSLPYLSAPPIASCIICIIQELHPLINWTKHTFTAESKCTKFYPPSRMVRVKRLDCNADMHAVTHLIWCHIHSQSGRLDTFWKMRGVKWKGKIRCLLQTVNISEIFTIFTFCNTEHHQWLPRRCNFFWIHHGKNQHPKPV